MSDTTSTSYESGNGFGPESGWLRIGSPEWHRAWDGLLRTGKAADHTEEHPDSGERWQYMGTWLLRGNYKGKGLNWFHQFRHRMHPTDGQRKLVNVPAEEVPR